MKSAKQILKEYGIESLAAEKALKAYAEQAIDRCAESAETLDDWKGGEFIKSEVAMQSILKVKSELK